ncbi:hypothetical protein M0802_007187 [Mischocyttarus mexicanus]|nr:hypothetical protein M0802_007187 [Mischocyttarus mexicanus]
MGGIDDVSLKKKFVNVKYPLCRKLNKIDEVCSSQNLNDKIELSDNINNLTVNEIEDHFNLQLHNKTNRIKRKCCLTNKSEYPKSTLTKDTKIMNKSFTDNDLLKYSTRYAHDALKCVTNKKMHFDMRKINKNMKNHSTSNKIVEKLGNVTPTSLQPLSSTDLDENVEHYYSRKSCRKSLLNELPSMSYFPRRKTEDRCLPCLYKSFEEIVESLRKNEDNNKRKKRIDERKISIDCESNNDDVSFVELNDQVNQNESKVYEKEMKFDVTEKTNISEEEKLDLQRLQGTMNEVKKTELFPPVPELKSILSDGGQKIQLEKTVRMSVDKSKDVSNSDDDYCDDDDDEESSITFIENSSTKLKYKPACHVPTILCHPLEPLRALKLRKSTSMQTRMAVNESSESAIIELDDDRSKITSTKIEQKEILKDSKNNLTKIDTKPIKKLIKIKSVVDNLIPNDAINQTKKKTDFLRRSSSCINLENILKDFTKGTEYDKPLNEEEEQVQQRCSLLTKNEIEEKLNDLEKRNASPTLALSSMCDMSLNRILELKDNRDKSRDNIAKRLVKLLIESKRYTNPDKYPSDLVHPPSFKDSTILDDEIKSTRLNPYGLFIKKERRKAIVWRPLTEFDLKGYDPEATLRMRADKITTDICKEFCEWLRSLGGLEKGINETVLKEMFEISFSADVCKSTQINVKEMATVPTDVALARLCPGASVLATTRKQLKRDTRAENKPKRTLAFGTSMPTDLLFIPPRNHVKDKWLKCKNVPRELETMDVVWDGIIHLESVQAFVKWLHLHPEVIFDNYFFFSFLIHYLTINLIYFIITGKPTGNFEE